MGSFFPLVSDDVCKKMNDEGFSVNYLACVVLAEAFFLKLMLEFRGMSMRGDTEKELTNWVVGSITTFRNPYFFDKYLNLVLFGCLISLVIEVLKCSFHLLFCSADVLVNMLIKPKLPLDSHLLVSFLTVHVLLCLHILVRTENLCGE